MKLDELALTCPIDEPKRVDTETFHHSERAWDGPVRHDPHDHVHRLRHERDEIPEGIVRRSSLREPAIGLYLDGVNQVRKFYSVLDEKNRDVISDQVEIAFCGIELNRKATHIPCQVARPALPRHGRESYEYGRLDFRIGKKCCFRVLFQ